MWPRSPVNWCPALGTVLANEEIVDGKSEVGGFDVIRKPMRQWVLKITPTRERLLEDLSLLNGRPVRWRCKRTGSGVPSVPRSISRLLMCRAICAFYHPPRYALRRYVWFWLPGIPWSMW